MPARVDVTRCDGCRGHAEPPCVKACPGDVVTKDYARDKARLRCRGECWDCYACVKACPRNAIQVELSYALSRSRGSLRVIESGKREVVWEVTWPDGSVLRLRRPAHVEGWASTGDASSDLYSGSGI